jgi:hypothetical protein
MAKLQQEFHEKMRTTHYAINTEISERISTRFKKWRAYTALPAVFFAGDL